MVPGVSGGHSRASALLGGAYILVPWLPGGGYNFSASAFIFSPRQELENLNPPFNLA